VTFIAHLFFGTNTLREFSYQFSIFQNFSAEDIPRVCAEGSAPNAHQKRIYPVGGEYPLQE